MSEENQNEERLKEAEDCFELGEYFHGGGGYEEAIELYDIAIEFDDSKPDYFNSRGMRRPL